ncbi:MAG: hypothetical protein LBU64_13940 [Planctomycetota bacterium]|jgi:anti-anti-sigma factor|nr:hypothetical protein [Planctomycetota bacterium]
MNPFEVADGVLRVYKELDFDYDVEFDRACSELVTSPQAKLIIDLSRINHITSTYIGLMAAAFFQAQAGGKSISVIARGQVLKNLRLAGFGNFMSLTDSQRLKAGS